MRAWKLMLFGAALSTTIVSLPRAAAAHAFPEHESPAAGATVAAPPTRVAIDFDAPIERLFAKLQVLDSAGRNMAAPPTLDAAHNRLEAAVAGLKPGAYTVAWRVVCADGHRTEGSYSFTVAGGPR